MSHRSFVIGPDGAEITVTADNQGHEQTCTRCGRVMLRIEPGEGAASADKLRVLGQLELRIVVSESTDQRGNVADQRKIPFNLCEECAEPAIEAVSAALGIEAAADVDEHQADEPTDHERDVDGARAAEAAFDELATAGAAAYEASKAAADVDEHQADAHLEAPEHVDDHTGDVRIVALLGPDGRDSGFTAHVLPNGIAARYTDADGVTVDEPTMRAAIAAAVDEHAAAAL